MDGEGKRNCKHNAEKEDSGDDAKSLWKKKKLANSVACCNNTTKNRMGRLTSNSSEY